MASEPRTKTSNELALDIVEKIDAYLDGSITGEDVIAWAGTFFARTWLSSEVVVESAIDALMAVGPDEYDTSAEELQRFRSYLLGEQDYVVHHRMVHWKSQRAEALRRR